MAGALVKITQDEVVERQTVLHIELEDEDLEPYLDRGYRRVVNSAMIPGFRKGKAPRLIMERYLGRESLLNEALDFMLPDVTQRAVKAQELETAGTPRVELVELEPVSLKATVAFPPLVDLGSYRDIRVEEEIVEVTEEDVQKNLDELLEKAASWEPVERSVSAGDMVTMAVEGAVEDRDIANQDDATYVVDKESGLPFPGFAEQLEGVEVGTPKEFHLVIPDDYVDTSLAGEEAHFSVSVSEVKEKRLPEVDDEFAKGVGDGYETLLELREGIEKDLKVEAEAAQKTQHREAALDALLKVTTLELPPLLVEHEVEHLVARRDEFVDRLNIRRDDYLRYTGKSEDQIQEEMRENAVEQLSRSWALAKLAESESLEVSAAEIDERIQAIVSEGGEQGERLKGADLDSEEVRSSISETLLVGRALDRLTAIARGDGVAPDAQQETPEGNENVSEEGEDDSDAKA